MSLCFVIYISDYATDTFKHFSYHTFRIKICLNNNIKLYFIIKINNLNNNTRGPLENIVTPKNITTCRPCWVLSRVLCDSIARAHKGGQIQWAASTKQSFSPIAHRVPVHPAAQMQLKPLTKSIHWPPFWHGPTWQSSISRCQKSSIVWLINFSFFHLPCF